MPEAEAGRDCSIMAEPDCCGKDWTRAAMLGSVYWGSVLASEGNQLYVRGLLGSHSCTGDMLEYRFEGKNSKPRSEIVSKGCVV